MFIRQYKIPKVNVYELWIMLILSVMIFELLYEPDINQLKSTGGILFLNVLGFGLLISEFLLLSFILWGLIYILGKKTKYFSKIIFAPKIYSPLPGIIFLLIAVSCVMGVFNPGFLALFRKNLLGCVFFIVYLNMPFSMRREKYIYNILLIGVFMLVVASIANYFNGVYLFNMIGHRQYILLTTFIVIISFTHLLFSKFSFKWLSIFLLGFLNLLYHIFLKSSIIAFILSAVVILIIKAKGNLYQFLKTVLLVSIITIGCYNLFFNTNIINYIPSISKYGQSFQDEIVRTVSSRIFKVDVLSLENLKAGIYTKDDILSVRKNIWGAYLNESYKGFGLAPYGFGYGGIFGIKLKIENQYYTQGSHNMLIFFALNSGLICALLITILIIRYIYLNIKILSNLKSSTIYGYFTKEDLIGVFSFTVAMIGIAMFEGSIYNVHIAIPFWFCVAVLFKRWDMIYISRFTFNV